jgi:hypothetical protein
VEEPFDPAAAQGYLRAILDGPGMTVFTKRAKAEFLENDMTIVDAVNVLRGGRIVKGVPAASGWTYRAETARMSVEFSFRGQGRSAAAEPDELVLLSVRRAKR